MLPRSRLAPVHGARRHVVDELVMPLGKALLLALDKERDFGPFERAIGVAEGAGAVLLAFRCFHALGVALDAGALDRGADLLLVGFAQAASTVFDVVGKLVEGRSVGFQQARDGTKGGES